jgi:hypothetical protein
VLAVSNKAVVGTKIIPIAIITRCGRKSILQPDLGKKKRCQHFINSLSLRKKNLRNMMKATWFAVLLILFIKHVCLSFLFEKYRSKKKEYIRIFIYNLHL